jgi:hypothetical protein
MNKNNGKSFPGKQMYDTYCALLVSYNKEKTEGGILNYKVMKNLGHAKLLSQWQRLT